MAEKPPHTNATNFNEKFDLKKKNCIKHVYIYNFSLLNCMVSGNTATDLIQFAGFD